MRERLSSKNIPIHPAPNVLWNFEKFVVGRSGNVVARFSPDTAPDDARLVAVLDAELAKPA
jgi:glutathione peroxidase